VDLVQAYSAYKKSADLNFGPAMFNLGRLYEQRGDSEQAGQWFHKAAQHGDLAAMRALLRGIRDRNDPKDVSAFRDRVAFARDCLSAAANRGSLEAMILLADSYLVGDEKLRDDRQAVLWYGKAAERNSVSAMYSLGIYWGAGLTLEPFIYRAPAPDYAAARRWLEKAASAGDTRARGALQPLPSKILFSDAIVEVNDKGFWVPGYRQYMCNEFKEIGSDKHNGKFHVKFTDGIGWDYYIPSSAGAVDVATLKNAVRMACPAIKLRGSW
jgi:TPR repeat protein